ncbi:hypothetical protein D3Z53_22755 [Lachnospiraceae bacterium]|nr:hypothetical protein [Lachnospiraceae bacterium]
MQKNFHGGWAGFSAEYRNFAVGSSSVSAGIHIEKSGRTGAVFSIVGKRLQIQEIPAFFQKRRLLFVPKYPRIGYCFF